MVRLDETSQLGRLTVEIICSERKDKPTNPQTGTALDCLVGYVIPYDIGWNPTL